MRRAQLQARVADLERELREQVERHQAERQAWAQAAAAERAKLLEDAQAERSGLIAALLDGRGGVTVPGWASELPVTQVSEEQAEVEGSLARQFEQELARREEQMGELLS